MKTDTIFPTYNARHYAPSEVAESFIWSENFGKLLQTNHSVILGARGCGKTTLMKMLTLPALYSWKNIKAESIKNEIGFYAIYISTDIYWDVKNQAYYSQLKQFGDLPLLLSKFSVATNVFTSICETFLNVIKYELNDLDNAKEIELSKYLIESWKLNSIIPNIKFVKEALNKRIDEVNQMLQNIIFNHDKDKSLKYPDFFYLSFETSLESIIPVFERVYNIIGKKQWALCFDELEFAPLWLQKELFLSLRSRKQYILYKLSASPILPTELENSIKGMYRASVGNDYELIKMWNLPEDEKFSIELIESLLKKKYPLAEASDYFGTNDIYNGKQNSYEKGSDFYVQMIELIKKDNSFKEFLKDKKVKLSNPVPTSEDQKDVLFRKIKPIVYYRNFFIKSKKDLIKTKYRSRKTNTLLSGIEVLSKVCDGNPRWLIGIINSILAKSDENGADKSVQFKQLILTAKRFQNVMGNIPVGNNKLSIIDITDKVAMFFSNQVLGDKFLMDPKGTFFVDDDNSKIPDNIVELIEKGISQGAFILLDSNEDSFDFQIRNRRFKLSYLFFALYDLPLRNYTKVNLSICLRGADLSDVNQISLF